ncbi:hypothetical protein ACFQNJ_06625 [Hydrogenophaga bisanensis]|uniref:DUF4124 domain-containing protein n=1 Tax=Hydrogenophaga bisanensis TaxID=439611 RepID=A0ABW2R7W4_9BURK
MHQVSFTRLVGAFVLCGLSAAYAPALAQTTYACKDWRGQSYRSLNPCPQAQKSGLIHYGPQAQPEPRYQPPVQRIERAGDELGYMSPKCATLQEGIRTAPNRGLSSATVRELRLTFERECSDEQSNALRAARQGQRAQEELREQEREMALQQKQRSQEDIDRYRQQCAEMRLSIHRRKQRPNPTEGELRDLALFEDRYQARCIPS